MTKDKHNIISDHKEYRELPPHYNRIAIADFEIESTTDSIKELEAVINRIIDKHLDFAEARVRLNVLKGAGIG